MSDDQIRLYFQLIQQKLAALQTEDATAWQEIEAATENLQLIYAEMQTHLEAAEVVQEELLQQNQQAIAEYYRYHSLFHALPVACLVTNAEGVILEANQAIAQLLNLPQRYLIGKPLALYVAEAERSTFRTNLNRIAPDYDSQVWQLDLCPRNAQPFTAQLHVNASWNMTGSVESLQIGVHNLSQSLLMWRQETEKQAISRPVVPLSPDLNGLQVLLVDDEADVREFITAVLESHGIRVRAVASAAAALQELEQFQPDVLVSDIRMPGGDGYNLIQHLRALEVNQGRHIPAAAITAYLEEDWEKALNSGFEAHLHKLARPTELIEIVARLAQRSLV